MKAFHGHVSVVTLTAAMMLGTGCRPATQAPVPNVLVVTSATVPETPTDAAWDRAPEYAAKLILQDLVEPRLLNPSTTSVRVRSISDGSKLAFRLEWDDDSENKLAGAAEFPDACAIQFPTRSDATVPAPQMGEPGRPVEVSYWNAAWQATADGQGGSLNDTHPNAAIDHYPFEAKGLEKNPVAQREMAARYAPAIALGNMMSGPRESPVEDLIAEGPGTLHRAATLTSRGLGQRTPSGWSVVISRPLPAGFSANAPTQVAFAVWRGDQQEVGARKMRTGWITLAMKEQP
jgi:DMSO reductase family type II enzyme heme b subunit